MPKDIGIGHNQNDMEEFIEVDQDSVIGKGIRAYIDNYAQNIGELIIPPTHYLRTGDGELSFLLHRMQFITFEVLGGNFQVTGQMECIPRGHYKKESA